MYTTAEQTRTTRHLLVQPCSAQMANLPNSLYQRYATPWTIWQNVAAGNTYGNVQAWVNAANTGIGAILGYQAATINVTPRYPLYEQSAQQSQRIVATQAATSDLGDGIVESNLQTLGTMRANSRSAGIRHQAAEAADILQRPSTAYGHGDLAANQPSNPYAAPRPAGRESDRSGRGSATDRLAKAAARCSEGSISDAAGYQQQYNSTVVPLTSGMGTR